MKSLFKFCGAYCVHMQKIALSTYSYYHYWKQYNYYNLM